MKKIALFIAIICSTISMSFSAINPKEVDFTVVTDPVFEGKFYPSLALWNSTQSDPTDIFFEFYLKAPHAGAVVRVTIEESTINESTIVQQVADEAGELKIYPIIKWKYEEFSKFAQGGSATLTFVLHIDGAEVDRVNQMVLYRPINECVYGIVDQSDNNNWVDMRNQFAMYVNEDYPGIDKILQEILAVDRNRKFLDYQGEAQDFTNQLIWVWEYFSNKGTRYSNVVNTSNVSELVGTQYVRFIDQTLNNAQANCVDGSALLASIYRKIGLKVYLVLVPGHCMMAVDYPGKLSIDSDLGSTGENGGIVLIETTCMGNNTTAVESFRSAVTLMDYDEINRRVEKEDYLVVDVEEARALGIMPIKRTMRLK